MSTTPAANENVFKIVFSDFVKMVLECFYTQKMIFNLMFISKCRQADFVASVSSPVSLTPAINYCQCCCYIN